MAFTFYGLALFHDQDRWNCIFPSITDPRYFVGLVQDTSRTTAQDWPGICMIQF